MNPTHSLPAEKEGKKRNENKARGSDAKSAEEEREHTEEELDEGLKETFPASDPVSISPGSD